MPYAQKPVGLLVIGQLFGEQVNKKLLYRESDLLDVGLVMQKARKQGGTALQLTVGFYINTPKMDLSINKC